MSLLLSVNNLSVSFRSRNEDIKAVREISFNLGQERLGIVGESGSGKTMTGRAILGLIKQPGYVNADSILFQGQNILELTDTEMQKIRGHKIAMIMQDPKYSLNPVMKVGYQICEAYTVHTKTSKQQAKVKAIEMLNSVLIRDPERVFNSYPHELSGGMGQRAMIAMMLIAKPEILIADEPTSSLDVTVQTEVLEIMDTLVRKNGMGLIFISHNLNLVSAFCDRIIILYKGKIVETCKADKLYEAKHPYTQGLLNSMPNLLKPVKRLTVLDRKFTW